MFHLINTVALLSVAGGLVFFYRSGMYSEKIVYAQKYVQNTWLLLLHCILTNSIYIYKICSSL
jgi:hypothetical protein